MKFVKYHIANRSQLGTLLILIFSSTIFSATAQIVQQPDRFEIELEKNDEPFEIIPLHEDGLILFRNYFERGMNVAYKYYDIVKYDTSFNKIWSRQIVVQHHQMLLGWQYYDDEAYFLFSSFKGSDRDFQLISINQRTEAILSKNIKNVITLNFDGFLVGDQAAYIVGYYNFRPVVIQYNFEEGNPRVLPSIFQERREILFYKIDHTGTFEVIMSGTTLDKRHTLFIKAYDESGNIVGDLILNNDPKKNLIFGNTTDFDYEGQLVAGTYGTKNLQYSRGFFIATVNEFGEHNIEYYNYGELKNFFGYMKEKREARVRRRIEKRKMKGKNLKFNYRLMVHQIFPYKDQYILLGEAFFPRYRQDFHRSQWASAYYGRQFNTFGMMPNRRYHYASPYMVDSYQYTHAVVIGFDSSGRILWDNSFEISDVSTPVLDQFVFVSPEEDRLVLLYVHDNVIRTKIIQENEVIEGKSFDDIRLRFEKDVVRSSNLEIEALRPWYYRTFYAYGVQTIRHKGDEDVKPSRRVFFINKVVYR